MARDHPREDPKTRRGRHIRQNSDHVPTTLDDWRGWISARAQELKRDYPSRSKKDCWPAAQNEWLGCGDSRNASKN
jgi:hypothetical protein